MSGPGSELSGIPSSRQRVRPGDVIAEKYVVERVLAEGGMGLILAAQHKQLRRRVALKFLLPELCEMGEVVQRFLREAQAMTTIQNEHVARVLDVGTTAQGSPYMVMEYLEGEDLGHALERRGPLPYEEAIDYVLQAMEALAEAHVHGFVHRDLKPSNLFVTQRPDGSPLVKVLDFGISKITPPTDAIGEAELTNAKGLLGSPLYMSPEQIRSSKNVDRRADIWTLGIILHELITGRPPFEGESVPAVLAQIVADDPISLASMTAGVPDGLSEVVLRCLRRNRDERYANVGELAHDLRPFASREGHLSVERIERVVAHHQRINTPVDLRVDTPVKNLTPVKVITPVHGGGGPAPPGQPLSPLAATAPDVEEASSRSGPGRTPPSSSQDDATFGKYKLLAVLGQGGMADVFLAVLGGPEGLGFSKLVVIKRLRSGLASDPEFVSMLVDEARIAAKLNHPNVVQTHEVGVIQNEYYIAMEYLDGQPLNRIVGRARPVGVTSGAIPLAYRLGIVRDLLAGVHHAHELVDFDGSALGLVHRDISPQNVFVTYDGQVKVVDFGIAKARGRATHTAQGIVKGKVAYMAPEQAGGQEIDRRADVFGAGIVLWELLTGERMWKGVDDVAIIQKLLLDKVPTSPRAVNADVPKGLDAIVKRALARKKEDRYASAQDFQVAIEDYMEAEGLKCTPRELGEWVGQLFADRRKQTRALVEGQLTELRSPTPRRVKMLELRESGGTPPSANPAALRLERLDHEPVSDPNNSRPDAAMARSHPGQNPAATTWSTRSRARWVFAAGAGLVVATLGGALLLRPPPPRKVEGITQQSVSPPEPSVVLSLAPSQSASDAPPAGEVHLLLASLAPGAEFAIDDEPKAKGPLSLARPKDGKAHPITASAPGFRPETKTFTFDRDVTWNVSLAPVTSGRAEPSRPHPSAESAPTASAAPPAPASSGRKKRELDPDPY